MLRPVTIFLQWETLAVLGFRLTHEPHILLRPWPTCYPVLTSQLRLNSTGKNKFDAKILVSQLEKALQAKYFKLKYGPNTIYINSNQAKLKQSSKFIPGELGEELCWHYMFNFYETYGDSYAKVDFIDLKSNFVKRVQKKAYSIAHSNLAISSLAFDGDRTTVENFDEKYFVFVKDVFRTKFDYILYSICYKCPAVRSFMMISVGQVKQIKFKHLFPSQKMLSRYERYFDSPNTTVITLNYLLSSLQEQQYFSQKILFSKYSRLKNRTSHQMLIITNLQRTNGQIPNSCF